MQVLPVSWEFCSGARANGSSSSASPSSCHSCGENGLVQSLGHARQRVSQKLCDVSCQQLWIDCLSKVRSQEHAISERLEFNHISNILWQSPRRMPLGASDSKCAEVYDSIRDTIKAFYCCMERWAASAHWQIAKTMTAGGWGQITIERHLGVVPVLC